MTGVGGARKVTHLAAPYLSLRGRGRPVALSPKSFLVVSTGPDAENGTPDDRTYLFTDVGGKNRRTAIPTPNVFDSGAGSPVRLSATRAVISSAGPDGKEGTGDDVLYLLDRLGTRNLGKIAAPGIREGGAGMALALDDRTVLIATSGPDLDGRSDDDTLLLIRDVGTKNRRTQIEIGRLSDDAGSRPVRLGSKSVGMVTCSPDRTFGTGDDRVALVADLGGANAVTYLDVGPLSDRANGRLVPVGRSSFLITNGGPDDTLGGGDDARVTLVTDAFGARIQAHYSVSGDCNDVDSAHFPAVLGMGSAAFASPGADDEFGTGDDDLFQVIVGLPPRRWLAVDRMDLLFRASAPTRPARISVCGRLALDDRIPNSTADVTVTVGNAAQTIPSASLKRRGNVWTYADPSARSGFLTRVVIDTKKRTFQIAGTGRGTKVETTHADYVPVAVTYDDVHLADPCAATNDAKGIHFRRLPRQ